MNKKYFLILLIISILFIFVINFLISKNYNNPEKVEERAIKYCTENGNEYREIANSDGKVLKQCKIDGSFVDAVEYYKSVNK